MSPKLRMVLWCWVLIVPIDQATKYWVENNVSPFDPIQVIPGFFHITHARNPGAALGLFQDFPMWIFITLTVVALVLIASFYRQLPSADQFAATALGLILAGASGNLIDRVWRQEVVDFLQFDLGLFVFPDFNVADSAIIIGVCLLLLEAVAADTEGTLEGDAEPIGADGVAED